MTRPQRHTNGNKRKEEKTKRERGREERVRRVEAAATNRLRLPTGGRVPDERGQLAHPIHTTPWLLLNKTKRQSVQQWRMRMELENAPCSRTHGKSGVTKDGEKAKELLKLAMELLSIPLSTEAWPTGNDLCCGR